MIISKTSTENDRIALRHCLMHKLVNHVTEVYTYTKSLDTGLEEYKLELIIDTKGLRNAEKKDSEKQEIS